MCSVARVSERSLEWRTGLCYHIVPSPQPQGDWVGLDTERADIKVDQVRATNVPGIYAAGDITSYPGKLELIATGPVEACLAVNNAVHWINPKAKVNPGHSSNRAIFGQKDD
jgi:thioredoxin reductase